ncbi:hypothetical protein DNTS_020880 [Danionella cerebrum]|uniref:Peroxisome assembly protein 26 n=1 Tax=Danionella cerebrum TaxID=2873325 RepID=A0A553QMA3_9TELE|nr:hypothetical protein DNTS_020880 [Danionella translucida]
MSISNAVMRSSASVYLGSGSVCFGSVEPAIEYLMVNKDFQAALDTCEMGLEHLRTLEGQEESCLNHAEMKASWTIVGIQALAELNRWRDVLSWVLQQYEETEKIPARIIQMCILLYVKVGEHEAMKNPVFDWLNCSANHGQSGFSTVAELYFLHILLPMGHIPDALEMLESPVGQVAFTEEQRQTAQSLVNAENEKNTNSESVAATRNALKEDRLSQRLSSIMRLLQRSLSVASERIRSISFRRVFLALMLLCLLLVRIDPALPASFPWLLQLNSMLQQTWNTMFGPYYRTHSRS